MLLSDKFVVFQLIYEQDCRSKTLIDNIFSNSVNSSYISGNITTSISDNLPQFLLIPNIKIKDLLATKAPQPIQKRLN